MLFYFSPRRLRPSTHVAVPISAQTSATRSLNYARVMFTPTFTTKEVIPEKVVAKEPPAARKIPPFEQPSVLPTQYSEKMTPLPGGVASVKTVQIEGYFTSRVAKIELGEFPIGERLPPIAPKRPRIPSPEAEKEATSPELR
ncbi:hypothetical protein RCL1_004079 [Eukaryota sp. TZLM3-RCL]